MKKSSTEPKHVGQVGKDTRDACLDVLIQLHGAEQEQNDLIEHIIETSRAALFAAECCIRQLRLNRSLFTRPQATHDDANEQEEGKRETNRVAIELRVLDPIEVDVAQQEAHEERQRHAHDTDAQTRVLVGIAHYNELENVDAVHENDRVDPQ